MQFDDRGTTEDAEIKLPKVTRGAIEDTAVLTQAKEALKIELGLIDSLPHFDIGIARDQDGYKIRVRFYGDLDPGIELPQEANGVRVDYSDKQKPAKPQ